MPVAEDFEEEYSSDAEEGEQEVLPAALEDIKEAGEEEVIAATATPGEKAAAVNATDLPAPAPAPSSVAASDACSDNSVVDASPEDSSRKVHNEVSSGAADTATNEEEAPSSIS